MQEYALAGSSTSSVTWTADPHASILDTLTAELEELSNIASQLEARLHVVMQPEYDVAASAIEPKPVQSPIRDFHDGLRYQASRFQSILNRLEV